MTNKIDHLTLNVEELRPSIDFYVNIMGFTFEKEGESYTEIRVNDDSLYDGADREGWITTPI